MRSMIRKGYGKQEDVDRLTGCRVWQEEVAIRAAFKAVDNGNRWRISYQPRSLHSSITMKSLCKCIVMLLCKDRGWYEIRHLFSIVYCLKCCTDRYFCLAIPDISTDQSVHDLLAFHIPFRIIDRI